MSASWRMRSGPEQPWLLRAWQLRREQIRPWLVWAWLVRLSLKATHRRYELPRRQRMKLDRRPQVRRVSVERPASEAPAFPV